MRQERGRLLGESSPCGACCLAGFGGGHQGDSKLLDSIATGFATRAAVGAADNRRRRTFGETKVVTPPLSTASIQMGAVGGVQQSKSVIASAAIAPCVVVMPSLQSGDPKQTEPRV